MPEILGFAENDDGNVYIYEAQKSVTILLESFSIPENEMAFYKNGAKTFLAEVCLKVDFDTIDSLNITILTKSDFIKSERR